MPNSSYNPSKDSWLRRYFPTVRRIWRGAIPLKQMVFFYFFAGSVVLALPINLAGAFGYSISGTPGVVYSLGLLGYFFLVCVGTWRSANHYEGPVVVAWVVKLSLLLIYIFLSVSFLVSLVPSWNFPF